MKKVTYFITCCVDCPYYQYGDFENFEARCTELEKDFNFPDEGVDIFWFPEFCPLEDE